MEPRTGDNPLTFNGCVGDAERAGCFGDVEARKEPELDDPAESRLPSVQFREGRIECEQIDRFAFGRRDRLVQWDDDRRAASFLGSAAPGMIDEHITHQARRQREEMRPIPRRLHTVAGEPHIRFMHEGGRLERVIRSLVTERARARRRSSSYTTGSNRSSAALSPRRHASSSVVMSRVAWRSCMDRRQE